jgi:hypothetical protein
MTLPSQPFREQASSSPTCERRLSRRLACNLETFCQPGAGRVDDFWWRARVRDISIQGICLLVGKRFEPGIGLLIELPSNRHSYTSLQTRVVHATMNRDGHWIIGCIFAWALSEEEIRACL